MSLYTVHNLLCVYASESDDIDLKLKLEIPPKKIRHGIVSKLDELLAARHRQVYRVVTSPIVNANLGYNADFFWVAIYLKENERLFKDAHPDLPEDDLYDLAIESYYDVV